MNIKIAALIGAASAIFGATSASASEIVNDGNMYSSFGIVSYGPLAQSFVAVDPWLKSIAFYYTYGGRRGKNGPLQIDLYKGAGLGGNLVASRAFTPTADGFFATDFTGTGLTAGSTYTAAVTTKTPQYVASFTENRYQGGQVYTPVSLGSILGKDASFYDLMFRIVGTTVSPVPEPATWALMLVGFGMVGGAIRHRRGAVRVTFA